MERLYSLTIAATPKLKEVKTYKFNIKRSKSGGFCRIFQQIAKNFLKVKNSPSSINMNIIGTLNEIIPDEYFGTRRNRKRFYKVVNRILRQTKHEYIFKYFLFKQYDIESMKWLNEMDRFNNFKNSLKAKSILLNSNLYILDHIVKPLIHLVYKTFYVLNTNEVKLIPRRAWISWQTKRFNGLLKENYLIQKNSEEAKPRGFLQIIPKSDLTSVEIRPIMRAKKIDIATKIKYKNISIEVKNLAKTYNPNVYASLYSYWCNISTNSGNDLYGLKMDVKDAFGNVNIEELTEVIINDKVLQDTDKTFLTDHINNQFVVYNKKIYQWNHGLLQGDHLSSILCELYMSVVESQHLKEFIGKNYYFFRTVDDYLYCSSDYSNICLFREAIEKGFVLNYSKTQEAGGEDENSLQELTYTGQVINFKTREVSKIFKRGCNMRHNFRLWNKTKLETIAKNISLNNLKATIIQMALNYISTSQCFSKLSMNTVFNSEETVLINFFKGMVFVAFKFDSAVRTVDEKSSDFLFQIIKLTVSHNASKVENKIVKTKGELYEGQISFSLLKNVGFRAFVLVLKKNLTVYGSVVNQIKNHCHFQYRWKSSLSSIAFVFTKLPVEFHNVKISGKSNIVNQNFVSIKHI